jgi:flagellar motor switch protein FliN/FliY
MYDTRQPVVYPNPAGVNVQPTQFQPLDMAELAQQKENIDIIMDVPLDVTVELGRTSRKIKEILEFAPGTVVDLDKLAGEPIDILVNGKMVATGEVVVVDENFAVRVIDIISVDKRI